MVESLQTSQQASRQTSRPAESGQAPSIGVLIDRLEDSSYHWTILRGATDAARDRGAHLVCFAGGVLGAPEGETGERNKVFDLADPKSIDALLLLSGPIGYRIGSKGLARYCERFTPLPLCSIGIEFAGSSSVCIDNDSGMRAEIEHLITEHGIKRIAFIRGPELNTEADVRYRAYLEVLKASGVPFAPELVVTGDFSPGSGREAVSTLLDTRKLPVHSIGAIVGANDVMALDAIEELARRGIRVPEHVAVAGFDDVEESRFALPPLTTVRQPLYEQGHAAVRHILDRLRTGTPPDRIVLRTEMVVRRSCGCLGVRHGGHRISDAPGRVLGFDAALVRRREKIVAEMSRVARGELGGAGARWEDRLLNAFAEQMRGDKSDGFIYAYDDLLRRLLATGTDPSICNEVISVLRVRMLACLAGDPGRQVHAEELFQEVRIRTAHVLEGVHASRRMRSWRNARALGRASAAIALARNVDELAAAVAQNLPALGISRCFLAEYEEASAGPRMARLLLAERPEARSSDKTWASPLPAVELLRRHVLPSTGAHAFAVLPIMHGSDDVGILILEIGTLDGYQYETLGEVFAAVFAHMRR
jgi:sigma-B regulation protein RsbU (phosphoserine phosphatase)